MTDKERKKDDIDQPATAILIAAKNGITEMVEKILEHHPIAMYDLDRDQKNVVHMNSYLIKDSILSEVDCEGNSALHLVAEADFN